MIFVHAHPDDEVVGTGATMARYAAQGARVTLVTCTLGEEGEIHVPELAGLAAHAADQLGGYRISEWHAACDALGVTDRRFLGGAGRYRDSGMMGLPTNQHPRAFWNADLTEAAGLLVKVLREVRPQVLVTYDPNGFYGHPDHVQAHRVATRAVELAADAEFDRDSGPAWQVSKVYWTAVPRSALARGMEQFRASADNPFAGVQDVADLPFGTPDEQVSAQIDGVGQGARKTAAMRAHATQIPPDSWLFALAANAGAEALGMEYYVLAAGERGPSGDSSRWEDDLFAGLDVDDPAVPRT
ncbi:MAG: N-acetyl-1-D-myo-inositol-2-amino-2-deoxy-alpha-D-glucopyranoside deacetylase [Micromonosporaceae bacterium]